MGFTQQQAEEALAKHLSFQQALDSLLAGLGWFIYETVLFMFLVVL